MFNFLKNRKDELILAELKQLNENFSKLSNGKVEVPEIRIPQPVVNIPQTVVNVDAPVVNFDTLKLPDNKELVKEIRALANDIKLDREAVISSTEDLMTHLGESDKKWKRENAEQFENLKGFVDLYRNDLSELKDILGNLEKAIVQFSKIDLSGNTKIIGYDRDQDQIDKDLIKGTISFLKNHKDNYEFSFDPDELYPRTISHSGILRIDEQSGQIIAPFEAVMTSDERAEIKSLIQPYVKKRKSLLVETIKDA